MKDYSVYPGEYIQTEEAEMIMSKIQSADAITFSVPPMNMDEYDKCYMIEIGLPGAMREDINVNVQENILSVMVLHKKRDISSVKALRVHEFEKDLLERKIFLPKDADTEFIAAEYREGMLKLCVPKTGSPVKRSGLIAVY